MREASTQMIVQNDNLGKRVDEFSKGGEYYTAHRSQGVKLFYSF